MIPSSSSRLPWKPSRERHLISPSNSCDHRSPKCAKIFKKLLESLRLLAGIAAWNARQHLSLEPVCGARAPYKSISQSGTDIFEFVQQYRKSLLLGKSCGPHNRFASPWDWRCTNFSGFFWSITNERIRVGTRMSKNRFTYTFLAANIITLHPHVCG